MRSLGTVFGAIALILVGIGVAGFIFPPAVEIEACHSKDGKYTTFTFLDIKKRVRTSKESTIEAMTEMGFEVTQTSRNCYVYRKKL